jgi:hypothetical protein
MNWIQQCIHTQHGTAQYNTTQHNTTQHNTEHHLTTRHDTTRHDNMTTTWRHVTGRTTRRLIPALESVSNSGEFLVRIVLRRHATEMEDMIFVLYSKTEKTCTCFFFRKLLLCVMYDLCSTFVNGLGMRKILCYTLPFEVCVHDIDRRQCFLFSERPFN